MNDGKPTGAKAKWWSRPSAGSGSASGPEAPAPEEAQHTQQDPLAAPAAADAPTAHAETTAALTDTTAHTDTTVRMDTTVPADSVPAAVTEPVSRPQPLHAPDPYSTPPYGGPGPWAPAPPYSGRCRRPRTARPCRSSTWHRGHPSPSRRSPCASRLM